MTAVSAQIDVAVNDPGWHEDADALEPLIRRAVTAALAAARLPAEMKGREAEVSVVLDNDGGVRALNLGYRNKDAPTNVLSFPLLGPGCPPPCPAGPVPLGDIVLARETIGREAREQGKSFGDHLAHLLIHGTLHLLGYDHIVESDAETMENLEIQILADMGIKNPYTEGNFMQ